jgi:hypothetical protein
MLRRRKQPAPLSKEEADYPSLKEHLLTRRELMTWMGASLITGSLGVRCMPGDDDSGPAYYYVRLPSEGDALATQAGGGTIRFYVNITAMCESEYYGLVDSESLTVQTCREVLAGQDFALLAAATQGGDTDPYHQTERELAEALKQDGCPDDYYYEFRVALTIVEFIP